MMKMRYAFFLSFLLLSCSTDDDGLSADQIEDCETGVHYAKMIWNDECWVAEKISFGLLFGTPESNFAVILKRERGNFEELFFFSIPANSVIGQKNYFYPPNEVDVDRPLRSRPFSNLSEDNITIATFALGENYDPEENYFIIDGFNNDSTEVEGRFQCILPLQSNQDRTDIPKMIEIFDGQFKLLRTD